MTPMLHLLLWSALAQDGLTPDLATLDRSLDRTAELVDRARLRLDDLSRAQARWISAGCNANRCHWKVGSQIVVDAREAGHVSRDLVQSSRAELGRSLRAAASPTVELLLDEARRSRVRQLQDATESVERAYLVRTAWYSRYMGWWAWNNRWAVRSACVAGDPSETR